MKKKLFYEPPTFCLTPKPVVDLQSFFTPSTFFQPIKFVSVPFCFFTPNLFYPQNISFDPNNCFTWKLFYSQNFVSSKTNFFIKYCITPLSIMDLIPFMRSYFNCNTIMTSLIYRLTGGPNWELLFLDSLWNYIHQYETTIVKTWHVSTNGNILAKGIGGWNTERWWT